MDLEKGGSSYNSKMIHVYISHKHEIKVGDKIDRKHEYNKGIISKILPRQDIPYFQDRKPHDMVFNPFEVSSWMKYRTYLNAPWG